jgi:ABC-type uncharacterized transport system involved in gliding motility auxiliary subunit
MKNIKDLTITKLSSWIIFVLILLNIVAFIFVANKFYFRIDMTDGQKYSLSKPTTNIIKNLKNSLIIEYYYNDKSKEMKDMAQTIQYVSDMLKEYENNSSGKINILIKELSYEKNKAQIAEIQQAGIQEFALNEQGDTEAKTLVGFSGIIIKYQDQQRVIPSIYNDNGFEYTLDLEIQKIIGEGGGKLAIITGGQGQVDKDYAYVKQVTEKEFSEVVVLYPGMDIPEDVKTLIIIGGQSFGDYDQFQIDQFFMRGGSAFIALNGINVIFQQYDIYAEPANNKLNELLASYGIKVNKNLIGDNDSYNALPQRGPDGILRKNRYPIWPKIKSANINKKHSAIAETDSLNLFWPSSIDIDPKLKGSAEVLAKTTSSSWEETNDYKLDIQTYQYPVQEGKKEFNIAYAINGNLDSYFKGKEAPKNAKGDVYKGEKLDSGKAKIIIIGNEYFIQNNFAGNEELLFLMNSVDWMSKDSSLVEIRNKGKFFKPLDKALNQKEYENSKNFIIIFTTYIIPLLLIITGFVVFFVRKSVNKKVINQFSENLSDSKDKEGEK